MNRARVFLEGLAGTVALVGLLMLMDCLPSVTKHPAHPLSDVIAPVCAPEAAPALLCNAATKSSPPMECVVCPDPARHCVTAAGLYCVTSCDEPLCERRK